MEVVSAESCDSELFYLRIEPANMDNPTCNLISLLVTLNLEHSHAIGSHQI